MVALALLMMGVTVIDVALRWIGSGIPGAYELVTLGMRILIPLALPYVFWVGGNVAVEMLTDRLPRAAQRAIIRGGSVFGALVMSCLTAAVVQRALTVGRSGELTSDLGLPQFWYWMPLIVGCALSAAVAAYLGFAEPPRRTPPPQIE
jgi:TRAP-type C4-dicarboxylate transport system permease small subunit